jgi:hypothetical protein
LSAIRARFEYPLKQIFTNVKGELRCRGVDGTIERALPGHVMHRAGDFPRSIRHRIWQKQSGYYTLEGRPWALLCQLDSGLYAFLTMDMTHCVCTCHDFCCHFEPAFQVRNQYCEVCGAVGCRLHPFWRSACLVCQGRQIRAERVALYVAPRVATLISCAMTEADYRAYHANTVPARHWDCDPGPQARRLALAMLPHRRLGAAAGRWAAEVVAKADVMAMVLRMAEEKAADSDEEQGRPSERQRGRAWGDAPDDHD